MKIISLNGQYDLRSSDGSYLCTASIPGSDIGNLMARGLIPDVLNCPHGECFAESVALKDMTFSRCFEIGDELGQYVNAVLKFEKLDTLCKVYLNGMLILSAENAHISYEVSVRDQLHKGRNDLKLCFESPLNYIRKRQHTRPMPQNVNGENGAQYLRKANCAFGWDWGPSIPYNYCGSVELRFFDREITDVHIMQKTDAEVSIVKVTAKNADICYLLSPSGDRIDGADFVFVVKDPELWYTRDLTETDKQPLYTVVLKNEEMTVEKTVGLRRIELDTSPDDYGSNFAFHINGRRVFAKGANVIPFAALPELAKESDIDFYIEQAAKSNFNLLRVWGGGEYADEHFMARCDELGILVWQDFCFACMMYPLDDKSFSDNVILEAEENVKRLSLHPSLALMCGNNEIEEMNAMLPGMSGLKKAYKEFFYHILPEVVRSAADIPYIPTSPVGSAPFKDNSDENIGDSHMWSVWHGLMPSNYYGARYARFLSEFGMESLPSLKSVAKFAPEDKSVFSPAFLEHQKCKDGNRKLMYYLCEKYTDQVDFGLLPYLTGIMQADCIKAAAEHFRRNKGRCNGAVFWQLNDVWNAPSWSAVDFEKVPKALMYKARVFFASVTLTFDGKHIFLHNDTLTDKKLSLRFEQYNGRHLKRAFTYSVVSKADSVMRLSEFVLAENDMLIVFMNDERYIFDNVKKLFPVRIDAVRDGNDLILCADGYARNVCIETDPQPSDNYFELLPGEKKRVSFMSFPERYRIICENDIPDGGSFRKTVFRLLYRMIPRNAVPYLWYRFHGRRIER